MTERDGYSVHVTHNRLCEADHPERAIDWTRERRKEWIKKVAAPVRVLKNLGETVSPHGGYTQVQIFHVSQESPVAFGESVCSVTDTYNKQIGRDIATGRAFKQLEAR